MIDKHYGKRIPVCDYCMENLPPEDDFDDAVQAMKAAGWKTKKDEDGEWVNICTDCQKQESP